MPPQLRNGCRPPKLHRLRTSVAPATNPSPTALGAPSAPLSALCKAPPSPASPRLSPHHSSSLPRTRSVAAPKRSQELPPGVDLLLRRLSLLFKPSVSFPNSLASFSCLSCRVWHPRAQVRASPASLTARRRRVMSCRRAPLFTTAWSPAATALRPSRDERPGPPKPPSQTSL
jgi:hypothetical protein